MGNGGGEWAMSQSLSMESISSVSKVSTQKLHALKFRGETFFYQG